MLKAYVLHDKVSSQSLRPMIRQAAGGKESSMRENRNGTGNVSYRSIWRCLLAAAGMIVCLLGLSISSGAAETAAGTKLAIKSIEEENRGLVEVHFNQKVHYRNVKVTVKDSSGKKASAVIREKDNDEVEFRIGCCKMGETYSVTISGVSRRGEEVYRSVKGKIWIPIYKGAVPVRDVDYDATDKEVEFTFSKTVQWKSPKVVITDGRKTWQVRIKEKNRTSLEVWVKSLKKGKKYQYKISGIRKKGTSKYTTITGTFMA